MDVTHAVASAWVVPATWQVRLDTGTLSFPNGAGKIGRYGAAGFITCRGKFVLMP